jgi:uncharacterized protein YutE (UPF0331/DUF86 family)
MDDRTARRIVEKASYVRDAVAVLVEKRDSLTLEEYCENREQRAVVERELQTAIEACIDIGELLLTSTGEPVPETNAAVFHRLSDAELIDERTATEMARAAGLRNVLAHQYGTDIDDEDVYNTL